MKIASVVSRMPLRIHRIVRVIVPFEMEMDTRNGTFPGPPNSRDVVDERPGMARLVAFLLLFVKT